MGCGCESKNDAGCPDDYPFDSRYLHSGQAREATGAVYGAWLGGGVVPASIGSGIGRVGGGITPANTHATVTDPVVANAPPTRVDIHFDYSTPQMIFERRPYGLNNRTLGGLQGGNLW